MTASRDFDVLADEIEWLRSFGMANEQVALRLGITVATLEQRDHRAARRAEPTR